MSGLVLGEMKGIKEVKETGADRFAESPLGRSVERQEFKFSESEYDKSLVKETEKN